MQNYLKLWNLYCTLACILYTFRYTPTARGFDTFLGNQKNQRIEFNLLCLNMLKKLHL
jgi:hypothetical protein